MPTVLILGGTAEARALAAVLHERPSTRVVSSLAGRVARPRLPVGEVRVGGFGGPDRLAEYLRAESVTAVVDATHPFAERISASAATAAGAAAVPLVLLRRPGWTPRPGDAWHWVDDLTAAAALLPDLGDRVFLTTGRQGLPAFAAAPQWFLVRCVDPPDPPLPARCELLLDRGPYTLDGELALMRAHRVEVLVTKDSGGPLTVAKLDAARELGLPVVVVRRPGTPDVPVLASVPGVVDWLTGVLDQDAGGTR
ncbi:cobalt-precorrin-6A reductase [Actinokineospora sp. PR83]|uniref:cobalt-precorrin-6A reductase n=1 Tax=Actinokineospora sp. PR83 TaxID=2884908 RepID=UPI0027E1ADC6|nr:cobalt-precorrin-6A reductase [Actinokineospora sp. PR83]MCG8918865.1 cobalt-precorrin-6A reductase [Actinokineospora sp. PR83]